MKKYVFIFGILISIFVASCTSRTYQELQPPITSSTVVTYNKQIKPIFEAKCSGCHGVYPQQFPPLGNYAEIKDACENGDVICRIEGQSCGEVMPQTGRMIQQNIDLIKLWKTEGYLE